MNWLELIPSMLSAVASIGAAVAAFFSLSISKRSMSIAEQSALAVQHQSASLEYSKVVNNLYETTKDYSEVSYSIWINWAKEIEHKYNCNSGGVNPRPLRHVLTNGSEMLVNYATRGNSFGGAAGKAILSVMIEGINGLNEAEYQKLLEKADHCYSDFESVLGVPSKSRSITSAPAFRWVCYQINKRVKAKDLRKIWKEAWLEDGYLNEHKNEYLKIVPILVASRDSLKAEKAKLAHSAFPLESNTDLSKKYNEIIRILDDLLDSCNYEALEAYQDWEYPEELGPLVLCSLAIVYFVYEQLNLIYMSGDE